jgi:ATPase related to the helicase subunit of the Holliday junction resolvase
MVRCHRTGQGSRAHQALAKRGAMSGRAFWLSGKSGTGKTTMARLIAQDVADPFLIQEVDASALTVAQLRDLESESNLKGFGERSAGLSSSTKRMA